MNKHSRPTKSTTVSVAEAKSRFSELLRLAETGERVVVTRHGKAIAELGPSADSAPRRKLRGAMKGEMWIAPDFDELGPEWDEYVK